MERGIPALASLIAPASVAVLGASDDPARIGGRPISYLTAGGFRGDIFPVNPRRETVQGIPAYSHLRDLPKAPDVAIVALPAKLIEKSIAECAARGVKACVVFTSGFAEIGEEGAHFQDRIAAICREAGMRMLGPNCLGVFNVQSGFYGTFTTTLDRGVPKPGGLSIVSQSGAFGSHLYYLARERSLGMRSWITTGNEADLEVAECLEWLANDPETKVIMAYAEGIRDGDRLVAALEAARRHAKPVIFMKVGRSEIGAEAASSHTAALAGSDEICDAVLRQYGAHRARTTQELIDIAYAASAGPLPQGRRLGLVTISGGVGVLMADEASDRGLDVAPMPKAAQALLKERLPYAGVRNPIDITAQAFNDPGLLKSNLECVLQHGNYDAVLAFFTTVPGSAANAGPVRAALSEVRAAYPDRPILLSMLVPEEMRRGYEAMGYPVFDDPSAAVAAIAALARFSEAFARPETRGEDGAASAPALPEGPLGEHESKRILAAAGLPVPQEHLACRPEEAVEAWHAIGGPVALKLSSPDILHKTELGGVLLGLDDAETVRRGYDAIMERARAGAPHARLDGVLVSPMETKGLEAILGVKRDPVFGPVVMLGLGGVLVEVLKDVTFRRAPVDKPEALRMISELRGAAMFDGVRGMPPADRPALAAAIVALSRLAAARRDDIESIDVNPFLVRAEGEGAVALDALIVRATE